MLNGRPGVSESTRQTVLSALDVLGYERPTQLRGDRARLVGLVLPELQNPIFPALAEVVGGALAQRGRSPVPYFTLPDRELERVHGESGRCGGACDDSGETNPGSMDHGRPLCASRKVTPALPAAKATG